VKRAWLTPRYRAGGRGERTRVTLRDLSRRSIDRLRGLGQACVSASWYGAGQKLPVSTLTDPQSALSCSPVQEGEPDASRREANNR
jgi:hypothetical protein